MVAVMTTRGYERFLYRRGGGRRPIRESDRPEVDMLECDVNLCCCPTQRSRNGGQWSRRGSLWWEGKARRPCCHDSQKMALDLLVIGTLIDYHFRNEQVTKDEKNHSLRG
jgi:hypothetical protein